MSSINNDGVRGILSLPNEILLSILGVFDTDALLKFAPICHRFYSLVLQVLLHRLQLASELFGPDQTVLSTDS